MKLRPHHVVAALAISTVVHAAAIAVLAGGEPGLELEGGSAFLSAELGQGFYDALQAGSEGEMTEAVSETTEVVTPVDAPEGVKAVEHATALVESVSEAEAAPEAPTSEALPPDELVEAVEPPTEPVTAEPVTADAVTPEAVTSEAVPMEIAALAPGLAATAVPTAVERPDETPPETAPVTAPVQASVAPQEAEPVPSTERLEATVAVPVPQARPADLEVAETRQPAPARKADTVKRQTEKPARAPKAASTSGAGGQSNATAKAGGSERVGTSSEFGNAEASNYMGQIYRKVNRAKRRGSVGRQRGEALIAFVVASNGSLSGVRVARSSGNEAIDREAVNTVQRAQPFPPIPPQARRNTWTFTVPIAF
ncbi:energy transducer TonB [Stappia sp. TSB10GB4]|uniref:energy transducer TonB family protein n=1 Tax=Stappia sp. TSB10GB4 TaxID=2003584 RepID=UPI0016462991|nr:TonB family protein [Stappia sp. TSB10GB4]